MSSEPMDGFLARQPNALDHGFAVLEMVAERGTGVTTRQLVDALPFSRATVYRLIKHLVAHEYLVRTPDLAGFALGDRVRVLGAAAWAAGDVTADEAAARVSGVSSPGRTRVV